MRPLASSFSMFVEMGKGEQSLMKSSFTVVVMVVLALALGACGSGGKDTTSAASQSGSTPAATRSPTSSSAQTTSAPQSTAKTATTAPPAATGTGTSTSSTPSAGSSTTGSSSTGTGTSSTPSRGATRGDESIKNFGQPASAAETQAVGATVKRYYAALAGADGATACSLLSARISRSLTAGLGRSPKLRDKGCPGIIALLFKHRARQASAALAGVEVTKVRVDGNRGFALLHSKSTNTTEVPIVRENGEWKVGALIGGSL
jgi:hypothetical protein